MSGDALGKSLLTGDPPSRCEKRRGLMAGRLPHIFDVSNDTLVAVRNGEAILVLRRTNCAQWIDEPIRFGTNAAPIRRENLPLTGQQPFRLLDKTRARLRQRLRPTLSRHITRACFPAIGAACGRNQATRQAVWRIAARLLTAISSADIRRRRRQYQESSHSRCGPTRWATRQPWES